MGQGYQLPDYKVHPPEVEGHKEGALLKVHHTKGNGDIGSLISDQIVSPDAPANCDAEEGRKQECLEQGLEGDQHHYEIAIGEVQPLWLSTEGYPCC